MKPYSSHSAAHVLEHLDTSYLNEGLRHNDLYNTPDLFSTALRDPWCNQSTLAIRGVVTLAVGTSRRVQNLWANNGGLFALREIFRDVFAQFACTNYCWILAIVPWCAIGRSLRRTNPTNRCTGNETCQDFALSDAKSRTLHWIRAKERIKREIFMKIRSAWGNHHFHFNCIDGFHRPTVPTCRSPPGFGWSFGIQQNTSQLAYPLE